MILETHSSQVLNDLIIFFVYHEINRKADNQRVDYCFLIRRQTLPFKVPDILLYF